MKKKNPFEAKGPITNLDVAKVLGIEKEYEDGLLERSLKEVYKEFLKKMKGQSETECFDFNRQFSFPVDYYKAKMLLKLLDEKTNLTRFVNNCDDLKALASFCDDHHIEILGYEVIKFTESEKLEEPPEMEYLGIIRKPAGAVNNQWAIIDKDIRANKEMNHKVYPILRISHETLRYVLSCGPKQLELINEFDVSMNGDPLVEIMISEILYPDGCCLNCGHEDFSFNGKIHSCKACGSKTILKTNRAFSINVGIRKEIREFVINLTGKDIK